MQQMVDNMMVANLPNKAVAVGEGWSQKIDMAVPVLGKLDCENKFTLKSVEQTAAGKEAVVAVAGKASSSKAHTAQMGPMQMTVNGFSMKMNGQNRFNVANPLLVTSQMTQSGSLDMTMTPPQEGQEPMVVKTKFDTKVTMTGRKAPKAESKTDGKSEKKAK